MNLISAFRYIQGERRGMGSQLTPPHEIEEARATIMLPKIIIQTLVRLADVSFWQGDINFSQMKQGLDGVIIRAGQRYWPDIRFKENWQKAKTAGIPRGSYWFYDSRQDPKKQAALWASLIGDDPGELVHAADFEESYGGSFGKRDDFKTFILEFIRLTGLPDDRIVIYTGFFWWAARVGNDIFFRRFNLWLAWYAQMEAVRVPQPWPESELLFWQYTSSGEGGLYGVGSKEIDLNWCALDMAGFSKRFNLGVPPVVVPPNDGGQMYAGKTNTIAKLWNNVGGQQIGELRANTNVRGNPPQGEYVFLLEPSVGWTKRIWLTSYVSEPIVTPPPPPPPDPDPEPEPEPTATLKHTIKTYSDGSYSIDDGPRIP
jgi:GH25 family lysozyme M1 (1,4-beta-N-acetylmuramidase)